MRHECHVRLEKQLGAHHLQTLVTWVLEGSASVGTVVGDMVVAEVYPWIKHDVYDDKNRYLGCRYLFLS